MSDEGQPNQQLMHMLHEVEVQYDMTRNDLSDHEMLAFWSELWRLSERVIADHRRLKIANRKRQRAR